MGCVWTWCVAVGCSVSSPPRWYFLAPVLVTTMSASTGLSALSWERTPSASVPTATRGSAAKRSSASTLSTESRTCSFPPASSHLRPTSVCRYRVLPVDHFGAAAFLFSASFPNFGFLNKYFWNVWGIFVIFVGIYYYRLYYWAFFFLIRFRKMTRGGN